MDLIELGIILFLVALVIYQSICIEMYKEIEKNQEEMLSYRDIIISHYKNQISFYESRIVNQPAYKKPPKEE